VIKKIFLHILKKIKMERRLLKNKVKMLKKNSKKEELTESLMKKLNNNSKMPDF